MQIAVAALLAAALPVLLLTAPALGPWWAYAWRGLALAAVILWAARAPARRSAPAAAPEAQSRIELEITITKGKRP